MPVTAQTSQNIAIGAGDAYVDGVTVGATDADNIFRVMRTTFTPHINGVPGKLKGTDYVQDETAELEVSVPELSASVLPLQVPGAVITVGDAAGVAGGGGENTTLAANTAIGDTNIKVASVAGFVIGDVIEIGAVGSREFRTVSAVGTVGAGGTGVTFLGGLTLAHATADAVIGLASTTIAVDAQPGALNLKVASVAGLAVGSWVRFGYAGQEEVRQLTFVGTAGVGGTGVSFAFSTVLQHRAGDYLLVQATNGGSTFGSNAGVTRRIPNSAYHNWELRIPALAGGYYAFQCNNAISIDNAQYDGKDAGMLAPRLKLQARWDGAAPSISPWFIKLPS